MDISQNETDIPGNPTSYAITRLTELKTAQNGERVRVLGKYASPAPQLVHLRLLTKYYVNTSSLVSFDPTTMLATIEMDGTTSILSITSLSCLF